MHVEVRTLFGRFVWRGVNIDDPRFEDQSHAEAGLNKPRSSASMAPDNGYLLEQLGWITCVAWKKQQREEMKR